MSSHYGLQLAFSFHIFLKEEMLAIINHIRELPYPVAENHHPDLAPEHEVELYVAVAVDVTVDVRVGLHILLGVAHEIFLVLAHVWRFLAVGTLHAAHLCPFQSEPHAPARMYHAEEALAYAVVEHAADKLELMVGVAQSVAMGEIEHLAVDVHRLGLFMENHSTFLLQIAVHPDVVVAGEVMHLHTHVGQLRQFAQEARVALGHHILVFIPEVEHIAEQIHGGSFMLDVVEESHQAALMHPAVVDGKRPEVGVR